MSDALLQVRNLRITLSGREVLQGIDLDLAAGEWLGLVGANGSGKTTLVRSICGRLPVQAGCVTVSGKDLAEQPVPAKQALGVCLEPAALPEDLSLRQFLDLWAWGKGRKACGVEDLALCDALDLGEELDLPLGAYSLGMKQKASLVAALMGDPPLLLLDESLSNLDPLSRVRLRELLGERHRAGCSILYCAHEFSELQRCCDRVLALEEGRIFAFWHREEWSGRDLEALFLAALEEIRGDRGDR